MPSVMEVAQWMLKELEGSDENHLFQVDAVAGIRKLFGEEFIVEGTSIRQDVRILFNKLGAKRIGYHMNEEGEGYWYFMDLD